VLTSEQAKLLSVGAYRQISPHLENSCLRVSANVSYAQACEDVYYLTGVRVPAKTQQRLVHGHDFSPPAVSELDEISVDGGKVRLRTPLGQPCQWKDYKAVVSEAAMVAGYQQNDELAEWVNQQPWATPLTCLGDGHDSVWKLVSEMGRADQRREVLDWFHLVENLNKVGGSIKRLHQAETWLWQGKVDAVLVLFEPLQKQAAQNFCQYLRKHRHRIIHYDYYQCEQICSIGSGAVESGIKQISRRIKISGAQWREDNVPQVLAHRCAYLNGMIGLQR
jgi:hypothetical protein